MKFTWKRKSNGPCHSQTRSTASTHHLYGCKLHQAMITYVEARQKLLDKRKVRGFWPPKGAGKGGFKGKWQKGKGGRQGLLARIAQHMPYLQSEGPLEGRMSFAEQRQPRCCAPIFLNIGNCQFCHP